MVRTMKFLQVKLRTFMLLVTAVCILVGWIAVNQQQHQREQQAIKQLGNRIRLTENVITTNSVPKFQVLS